jgi:hypothetical protein
MAQENIPLVITLGGVDKAITSVRSFVTAIKEAEGRLLSVGEEGSDAYKKLQQEIAEAKNRLTEFREDVQGTKVTRELKDFIEVGSSITAAFAGASAALQAFGLGSEEAGRASAIAQNLLTVALAAQTVAQNRNALAKVGNTVSTVAQTVATQGLIGATRLLYTTLLANPFTAIIILVGALATAYQALTSESREAEKSQKEFNKTLDEDAGKSIANLQLLVKTVENTNLSLATRKKALKDLRNEFPAYFKDLKDEAILNGDVRIELDKLTEALIKSARARALQTRLESLSSQELDAQRNLNKLIDERNKALELSNISLTDFFSALAQGGLGGLDITTGKVLKTQQALDKQNENLLDLQTQQKNIAEEILKLNEETDKVIGVQVEEQKDNTDELKKQQDLLIARIRFREEELRLLIKQQTELQKTGKFELSDEVKKGNEEQKKLNESYQEYVSLVESFNKASGKEQQLLYTDQIGSLEEIVKLLDENSDKLRSLDFPQAKIISQRFDLLSKSLAAFGSSISVNEFRDVITAISELDQGEGFNLEQVQQRRLQALELERTFVKEYVDFRIKSSKNTGDVLDAEREEYQKTGKQLFDTLKQASGDIDQYTKSVEDAVMELKRLRDESQKLAADPNTLSGWAQQNRQQITNALTVDLGELEQNRKDIETLEKVLLTGRFDQAQQFAQDIEFIEYDLIKQGIDIRKVSYEEKLKLLKLYLEKEVKETEDAEGKKRKSQEETLSGITGTIQAFQSVLNSLAQTTSQYYAFQLDLLAKNSQEIQKQIVGDSEEAVQLRLEQEQIYNEKKKQLEKQAAVTALRISLAQSIANVAESITRAFTAGPVIGQIAAGIIAGIGVAQTALIGSQLSQIQSLQRGGIIKGQGGLVVGPSHEYGGVKFQGGGIELEGGEAVINRQSAVRYGSLLSSVNQLGGGKPLVSNNFDDSRIVEAIAKQRSEPIRAYVVEQDITSKQGVTRRLEQLSQI